MEIERLGEDAVLAVLRCLDSDADIARAATVCRSWHSLVVEGRLWRQFCQRKYPELDLIRDVITQGECMGRSGSHEEHLIFSNICDQLTRGTGVSCLRSALHASSTDHSSEDISQTLYPSPSRNRSPSYWSSTGQLQEDVPETLTYKLAAPICLVREVCVRPFEAYFQNGYPIYSSKHVRFRFGYQASKEQPKAYVWTYVSPVYSMEQADFLQTFVLPSPVLCVGGIFQAELMGRVQKQRMDELYYICICHVSVLGRPLGMYDLEMRDDRQSFVLKQFQESSAESDCQMPAVDDGGDDLEDEYEEEDDFPADEDQLAQFMLATHQMNEMFEEYRMAFP